jgi:inositol-phosphate phosphatase / L-galactose 1-phosphate phosphatase / histidinol-phosphatase
MKLHPTQRDEWRAFAHALADAARSITTRYFRTNIPTQLKADDSPVTLADQQTERVLRDMIRARYPDHGIYGEEEGLENEQAEWRWVIDPIDGTKAFLAGIPTFVTLIALCRNGRPLLSIIDQPILQERWAGCDGETTQFNGADILRLQQAPDTLAQALIGTTDPALFAPDSMQAYGRLRAACGNQICGGDGYIYGRLCSGTPHVICEYGLKPHDFAALVPVIQGAGGVISDWRGNPLTVESAGDVLAATTPTLHQLALTALQA